MSESDDSAGYTRAMVPTGYDPGSTPHTPRANFKCPVPRCGLTFVHHYELRSHIRTHSQEHNQRPSPLPLSLRSTPESSSYQSDVSSQERTHTRAQQRGAEGSGLSISWQSGDTQPESQSSISNVWSQPTTHPAPSLAALSLNDSGAAISTPPRNSPSPRAQHETESGLDEVLDVTPPLFEIRPTSEQESSYENTGPGIEAGQITQGMKRRLEEDHEQNSEERGGNPKRGKVIHRDYADMSTNYVQSSSPEEHSASGATQDRGTNDPASDLQPPVKIESKQLSCQEMFQHLVAHGCIDLSSYMDPAQYSAGLIQGGAFGDIWKGKLHDGTEVAIKVWRFSTMIPNDPKSLKRAMREIYHWSKMKHEYVQELMGVIMFQERLGMVSRWMEHGNLREYICKNPAVDRYTLCMQVAAGIEYLHDGDMVHGDLKGANILVSSDGAAKLSDFDHSIMSDCSLAFSETSKQGGGTTRWMAPELILEDNCRRSSYTDVYALGMTMLEIITGTSPYYPQCQDDVNVIRAIMKGKLPTRPNDHLGNNTRDNRMWDLLLSCWNHDPSLRPKAAEVVKSLKVIVTLPMTSNHT